jgi:hypothetical protein
MSLKLLHEKKLEETYTRLAQESERAILDGDGSAPDREELIQEANVGD